MYIVEASVVMGAGVALALVPVLLRRRCAMDKEVARHVSRIRTIGMAVAVVGAMWLAYEGYRSAVMPMGETIHRVHAGTRGTDNWFAATSTKGRFGVRMPIEFDDTTTRTIDDCGRDIIVCMLTAMPASNAVFTAQLIKVAGPAADSEPVLRQFETDRACAATSTAFRVFTHKGSPGLDNVGSVMTPMGRATLFMRRVRAPEGLYLLTIACAPDEAGVVRRAAAYFFESLQMR